MMFKFFFKTVQQQYTVVCTDTEQDNDKEALGLWRNRKAEPFDEPCNERLANQVGDADNHYRYERSHDGSEHDQQYSNYYNHCKHFSGLDAFHRILFDCILDELI